MSVHYEVDGGVAILTIDNPPVNALSHAVRLGIHEGIARGVADEGVRAIVLIGRGGFIAGADIKEFGQPPRDPSLRDLFPPMEASRKPIVAAIAGSALGGGLEVALAAHFRIAAPDARLGLPEVNIGLLPGAGGTVRLPRLIGPEAALDIMLSGKPAPADRARDLGLVDEIMEGDLREAAVDFARAKAEQTGDLPVVSRREDRLGEAPAGYFEEVRRKNGGKWRGLVAPPLIVDCVERATREPFAVAYAAERDAFMRCMESPARKALMHVFFAERAAAKVPGIGPEVKARPIRTAAVIGAGTMGGGIAMSLANAGIFVTQLEVDQAALDRGRAIVEKNYATSVARGSTSRAVADAALGRIEGVTDYAAIGDCDIVIEAVFENMALKKDIFARLDRVMKPGAVLATNTSTLSIDEIAAATARPEDVVGTHFFSPANVMKLQENVRGATTSPEVIVTVMTLARQIGKVPVLAGNGYGFIGNRILHVYGREADFLVEEGATPWQVDDALMAFGFPMGVYRMRDLAGLDVGWRIRKELEPTRDKTLRYSPVADRLAEQGRFGQKTGAGYYRYEGRDPIPDPEVQALIERTSAELGIHRRPVADEEIVTRVLTAMVNEGAKILDEGIAIRAGDIDVTYVYGYGFPRWQGGPMFWAERRGLDRVHADVLRYHAEHGRWWEPSALLARLAESGQGWDAAARASA